jgi:uncharacterized protein YabN with tetrapyrrole methylase and pyrophosphatase domain
MSASVSSGYSIGSRRIVTDAVRRDGPAAGSLVVVGTGITLIGQTTPDALACMRSAEKLFYLVTDAAAETWIRQLNSSATSLDDCYGEGKPRRQTYAEMTSRILSAVRQGLNVCAAFYGHPGVFVTPSHESIRQARREGFSARMLPGISAEDCLFADLGVDPGQDGCQSHEATDFLLFKRTFDPCRALGESSIRRGMKCRPERLQILTDHLRAHYEDAHEVVLYEAAQFPICDPIVKSIRLVELPSQDVPATMTVYIPPRLSTQRDESVARWLTEI